jgi:hypothetical protein
MLILEAPFSNETFYKVKTLEDIKTSPNNSTLVFEYCNSSLELYNFCKINNISYAVKVNSVKEFIFVSNLKAKYVFCDTILEAKILQKIADNYLTDTKVVYLASSLDEIEEAAKYSIDAIKLKGSL